MSLEQGMGWNVLGDGQARGDHRTLADLYTRFDMDAGAKANAVTDPDAAGGDDGRAKAAVASQPAVVFNAAISTDKIVVANGGAGAKMAECHDHVALAPPDVDADDAAWMNDIGK